MFSTKAGAASLSIASNATLIVLKIAAGAITGSIAIITEAIHSAIDLLASIVAYFSVREADEPADREHPYGHEKVENLAAAIEGMLILVGAGIIIFEATRRLVNGSDVEDLGIGIAVIAIAAVANICVSTFLYRRAKSALLAGARGRRGAPERGCDDLVRRSGGGCCWSRSPASRRGTQSPRSPSPVRSWSPASHPHPLEPRARRRGAARRRLDRIEAVIASERERAPEIAGYHKLRARRAGARRYIDLHLQFRAGTTLEQAHSVAHSVRGAIERELPDSDVLIDNEPEEAFRPPRTRRRGQ